MNHVTLIGYLASEPEMRRTAGDVSVCTFRLAVQRKRANQQGVREADFLTVVCWRTLAEICGKYLSKGRKCAVEGCIQTRSWDAQDGTKRYGVEIVAEEVEFLTPKGERGQEAQSDGGQGPDMERFTEVEQDDDLPF